MKIILLAATSFVLYNTVASIVLLAANPAWRPALNFLALAAIRFNARKHTKT